MATRLRAIDEWPPVLLAEFGVLTGASFARVDAEVKAEREEAERRSAEEWRKYKEEQKRQAEEEERRAAERRKREIDDRLRHAQEVPLVGGQFTIAEPLKKKFLAAGHTDEMIEAAVAVAQAKRVPNAGTFPLLVERELAVLAVRALRDRSRARDQQQVDDQIPF